MTVSQDLQLYKEAASEEESGPLASNEFVAIQKIGPEAIIEGIKSNWVCVYILDEDKFRNGFLYESLTRQNYSYYKENVDHETAIEKITASQPKDLFGTEEIALNHWEIWISIKPYSLENYREVTDGDYFVNKIFASSVQDDLIYPYENASLALHVEGENAWLFDAYSNK